MPREEPQSMRMPRSTNDAPALREIAPATELWRSPEEPTQTERSPEEPTQTERSPEEPTERAETAGPSLHQFHEWSIKRLERRQRKLTWALAATAALFALILGVLVLDDPTARGPASQRATVAAAEAAVRPLQDDPSNLAASVDGQARDLQARIDRLETAMEDPAGPPEMTEALSAVRRELNALKRCTSDAIQALDVGLRGLLTREVDAEEWVNRPVMEGCR